MNEIESAKINRKPQRRKETVLNRKDITERDSGSKTGTHTVRCSN